MPNPFPITTLEVIAYASRLTDSMLPAVVPPVFRMKGASARILLPPFTMRDDMLHDATEVTETHLKAIDEAGEVTFLEQPLDARPDFELWVELDGTVRYEPVRDASTTLRAFAMERVQLAMDALAANDLGGAANHSRIALNADDRLMEPLAISAAIARRKNQKGEERLMEKLAQTYLTSKGFEHLVHGFASLIGAAPVTTGDLFADHPMKGMATIRPDETCATA